MSLSMPLNGIEERPEKICARHLERLGVVYIRQSSMQQVHRNQESTKIQYSLVGLAQRLGWVSERILVIDDDLGTSAASALGRQGFQRLLAEVALDHVGIAREGERGLHRQRWHPRSLQDLRGLDGLALACPALHDGIQPLLVAPASVRRREDLVLELRIREHGLECRPLALASDGDADPALLFTGAVIAAVGSHDAVPVAAALRDAPGHAVLDEGIAHHAAQHLGGRQVDVLALSCSVPVVQRGCLDCESSAENPPPSAARADLASVILRGGSGSRLQAG